VGTPPARLAGPAADLCERLGQVRVPLRPGAFYQVNPEAGDLLVGAVLEAAARQVPVCPGKVVDLYCGAGAYALNFALGGWDVVAVDRAGVALGAGSEAARAASLQLQWVRADATAWASSGPGRLAMARADLVLLNPPRRGSTPELLSALAAARPPSIIYVSCSPTTLARDAAELQRAGYRLVSVQPVDLMPQTAHVETVASFVARDP